jgi:3-deoxy-D-manno-octulosonate 8-phosphate phosphatase (KDO 8-P phosphatase)
MNYHKYMNFLLDVDGVLTSGSFLYNSEGKVLKEFGPHDSYSLNKLKTKLNISFISADKRGYEISEKRISDMGFELSLVSEEDRLVFVTENFNYSNLIYMGDGDADAPILKKAFKGIAPSNARPKAIENADFVTNNPGGSGAVADACDWIENYILTKDH